MMARLSVLVGVFVLSGLIDLSVANKDTCEFHAAVGQSLTLPFVYDKLTNSHVLRWTHGKTIVFYRQQGKVSVGKAEDISASGSLLLKNLQVSSAGVYQATVLSPNGTLAKTWTGHLCMMDKVTKPQLTFSCDPKSVTLKCNIAKTEGVVFSWTLDEKTLPGETSQTLSISLMQLKGERSFTCGVSNKVSKENSVIVRPTCKSPPPPPMLCFTSKTVVAVLTGGAALILLLLIIIIILLFCHKHNKSQGRLKELRMLSVSKREHEYETMQPTGESPAVSLEPPQRACYENVSKPETQSENTPPQPSTAAEGHRPSPVPKPRTKNPQTVNM